MDWFWVAVILYLLGAANVWILMHDEEDEILDERMDAIQEMEREDDIARVTGWLRGDWSLYLYMLLATVFWPVTTVVGLYTVVVPLLKGKDPWSNS